MTWFYNSYSIPRASGVRPCDSAQHDGGYTFAWRCALAPDRCCVASPREHKFKRLNPTRKLAINTVRMIAFRTEKAIAAIAGTELSRPEEARSMVKAMFNTTVNLHPDTERKKLRVVLHPLAETRSNKMAEAMLAHLNEAKFTSPGTELQMVYEILMPMSPSG